MSIQRGAHFGIPINPNAIRCLHLPLKKNLRISQTSTKIESLPKTTEDDIFEQFVTRLEREPSIPKRVVTSISALKLSEISEKRILEIISEANDLAN